MTPNRAQAIKRLETCITSARKRFDQERERDRIRTGRPQPLPVTPQFWSTKTRAAARRLQEAENLLDDLYNPRPKPQPVRWRLVRGGFDG